MLLKVDLEIRFLVKSGEISFLRLVMVLLPLLTVCRGVVTPVTTRNHQLFSRASCIERLLVSPINELVFLIANAQVDGCFLNQVANLLSMFGCKISMLLRCDVHDRSRATSHLRGHTPIHAHLLDGCLGTRLHGVPSRRSTRQFSKSLLTKRGMSLCFLTFY